MEANDSLSSSSDEDLGQGTRLFQQTPAAPEPPCCSFHSGPSTSGLSTSTGSHQVFQQTQPAPSNTLNSEAEPGPSTRRQSTVTQVSSTGTTGRMSPNIKIGMESLVERGPSQKNEKARLLSFAGYPNRAIDLRQLAAAGFYYTKSEDIVRCAFCGVEVGRWEEGDNPLEEHKKWSKNCCFLNGSAIGNVPVDPLNPPPLPALDSGVDDCGLYGVKCLDTLPITPSLEKLGIQRRYDPVHPVFSSLEARLDTYSTWPVSMKLRPQELADAGFFYTGLGDKTACFQCGGGLKDWNENDDPWREHALFFSKCSYVLQSKGREFVAEVLGKKPPTLTPAEIQALKIPKELSNVKPHSPPQVASSSNAECSLKSKEMETSKSKASPTKSKAPKKSGGSPVKKIDDARACKICFSEEMGVLFLPCGHLVACPSCAASLSTCAVCRQPFTATVRAFLS